MTSTTRWGKRLAEKLARRLGYIVLPAWQENIIVPPAREHTFHAARYLRRLFDLLAIDCVIDVGANLGQYRSFLRDEVGYTGVTVSFEPIPSHAQILKDRARGDPKWLVEGCALGTAPGTLKLNVMIDTQFSSFLAPSHREVTLFRDNNKICEQIEVEVRTFDTVIPMVRDRFGAENIYVKLDTQGFDLEVIRGAEQHRDKIQALQFEASVRQIYDGAPRYDEVIRHCEQHGFPMSGIFPNNAGFFPILVEFDCFMVRREWGAANAIRTGTGRLRRPPIAGEDEAGNGAE
ncbi:MAG: FkbM family methyltransferase [Stellaceae bacterium]